ncbi:hypothetical protein BDY21DRAFT_331957 [Lineolata rhizophorae]|uniref:Small EDRK-rich factor-like N-terminal domain-containing protein n=1 Tax=Lineolata rhizophorae TaxID=578093 RepID=A0A6A6PBQ6_9PEZI|nr:hypothetical protein BDY21DRAFT_331957 [Lineolata rhizophorae]
MARGNQREKAREKNLKAQASEKKKNNVSPIKPSPYGAVIAGFSRLTTPTTAGGRSRRSSNMFSLSLSQLSGTEFARVKEDQAAIMRAKQAAGKCCQPAPVPPPPPFSLTFLPCCFACRC